ncbi:MULTISPECIES: CU044_5270 family protein [unclassified Amycolatopsis]|uniref:CU044_5270 family protein n=1 Tax=unclassified Amycolatopsis TaxID=2618356 RepID=UPI001C6A208B|nr:CU044_5270 family protein [Amycolatopsis sp. DSM 110486]QYN19851.1 CU044_5270 family protein [Amycolatopsis sp. DSM 110486]
MDELQLVRDRAADVPLPDLADLGAARARLLAAAASEPRRKTGKRLRQAGAATLGLAAAITAVVSFAPTGDGPLTPPQAAADPVRVLHGAAAEALKLPDTPPRPDQFVYVKTQYANSDREAWISADGKHDGYVEQDGQTLTLQACVDGKYRVEGANNPAANGREEPCVVTPAYRTDLPTTADAMFSYLNKNHSGDAGDANAMGKDVQLLVGETYLRPQTKAALFDAAAKVPGLQAVDHVTDAAGRPGVGITWPGHGVTLVFDAKTYTYLGTTQGAVVGYGIVDHVGQLPR